MPRLKELKRQPEEMDRASRAVAAGRVTEAVI
jgi:hypothetical protein